MWPAADPAFRVRFVRLPSGASVRVVEQGPEDGPPVLMLPGWGVCVYTFRGNMPRLAAEGCRAIAVDLRGHGLSDKPVGDGQYTLPAMVAHVQEIVAALGLDRFALVAQSMAGRIAIELALATPDRVSRLALISPVALGRVRLIGLGRLSARPVFGPLAGLAKWRRLYRLALETAYGGLGAVEPHDVDEYWAQSQFPGYIAAARSLLGHFDWNDAAQRVDALTVPVTVFRGTRDRIVAANAKKVAARARLAMRKTTEAATGGLRELVILEGAGHALNEEAPAALNAALLDAVRGEPAGRR